MLARLLPRLTFIPVVDMAKARRWAAMYLEICNSNKPSNGKALSREVVRASTLSSSRKIMTIASRSTMRRSLVDPGMHTKQTAGALPSKHKVSLREARLGDLLARLSNHLREAGTRWCLSAAILDSRCAVLLLLTRLRSLLIPVSRLNTKLEAVILKSASNWSRCHARQASLTPHTTSCPTSLAHRI